MLDRKRPFCVFEPHLVA